MAPAWSDLPDDDVLAVVALMLPSLLGKRKDPVPQHTSVLTGKLYYEELMNTENEHRFRDVARMNNPTFKKFLHCSKTKEI